MAERSCGALLAYGGPGGPGFGPGGGGRPPGPGFGGRWGTGTLARRGPGGFGRGGLGPPPFQRRSGRGSCRLTGLFALPLLLPLRLCALFPRRRSPRR